MKFEFIKVAVFGLCSLLAACIDQSSPVSSVDIKTGVFLDSPVINIGYRTESLEGSTNSLGEFRYIEGETVTFYIGRLELPTVTANHIITPLEIANTKDTTNATVVNIIRLLQSLDEDGDPSNGIKITETAKNSATQLEFEQPASQFESSDTVMNFVANSGSVNVTLVSSADAIAHFEATLSETNTHNVSTVEIPQRSIFIDGNNDDWSGIHPLGVDDVGNQYSNPSADLVKLAIAQSGEETALFIETRGNIDFYHTADTRYSAYDVVIKFYDTENCQDEENGSWTVTHFSHYAGGDVYYLIEGVFEQGNYRYIYDDQMTTAHAGNVLEMSFSSNILPKDQGNYISLSAYVKSYSESSRGLYIHDTVDFDVCLHLPAEEFK